MNNLKNDEVDLKTLEKKAYRSTFQDGFWDLFIGMLIFGFSLSWTRILYDLMEPFGLMIIILIWNTITFLIFYLGKKFITIPRMGIVKFGPKREVRKKKLKIFLLINVLFGFLIFILTLFGLLNFIASMGIITPLLIGLVSFTFPFSIIAYFLEFNRLYIYSVVCGLLYFFADLLYPILGTPLESIIAFGVPSGVIIIIGLTLLIKFVRKYPKPPKKSITEGNSKGRDN